MGERELCARQRFIRCAGVCRSGRVVAAAVLLAAAGCAGAAAAPAGELADLSLEQLTNIQVTSVSRRAEPLAGAAASIYVITAEDIRRAGVRSLPEALRLAPNLQVARADANQYAISARGFNSTLANKMLVLVDGRTVYSPLFSGVFWEAQDVMLEDIERIEVIDGPGGTLWGSNAVNGVINIITRSARATQGALAAAGDGSGDRLGAVRYGGPLGDGAGAYRLYAKYSDQMQTSRADGTYVNDASWRSQAGFRADWGGGAGNTTLQGDAYDSDIDQVPGVRKISGANLLGRWTRQLDDTSSLRVQAYVDHTERQQPQTIHDIMDTYDVEFQHALDVTPGHHLIWGGGYRYSPDRVDNKSSILVTFSPANRNLAWSNVFVQDEIAVGHDVRLTGGLKFEHNVYTGWEALPNVRAAWNPAAGQLLWGEVSRSVRAPARIDRDVSVPANPPFVLAGGPDFRSEVVDVAELGYRAQPTAALSYSITAFHSRYDRLRSLEPSDIGPVWENKIGANANGAEAWANYRVIDTWRLGAGLFAQRLDIRPDAGSQDLNSLASLGNDPSHWWSLRSSLDFGPRCEFDVLLRHVGALPNPAVPAYTALDARLGWRVNRQLELSLTGQNLFDPSHAEWGPAPSRAEFVRSVFAKLVWRTP